MYEDKYIDGLYHHKRESYLNENCLIISNENIKIYDGLKAIGIRDKDMYKKLYKFKG